MTYRSNTSTAPTDVGLIEDVFDRLNRNGEPLKGQELRNAQYHSSTLMQAVNTLVQHKYLKERLSVTDLARMEDKKFASECLLTTLMGQVIGSNQETLDRFYMKHISLMTFHKLFSMRREYAMTCQN